MPGCNYTYYLFNSNDPENPKVIPASFLKLEDIIKQTYPNISKAELTPNRLAILFNMMFDSNEELLNAIVYRYKEIKPGSKLSTDNYDYVTFMVSGKKAKDYGFFRYSYSKKDTEDTQERMSPIIYKSDLANVNMVKSINPIDFTYPKALLNHIITSKHDTLRETEFNKQLEKKLYEILVEKYDSVYENTNNDYRSYNPDNDKYDFMSLLNCALIKRKYKPDSSLYYNLLAIVFLEERIKTLAEEFNLVYDPKTQYVGSKPLRIGDLIQISFKSLDDYRDLRDKNITLKEMNEESKRIPTIDEITQSIIDEYNFEYGTYITRSDIEDNPEQYEDIIQAIEETIKSYKGNGSQRK